MTRTIESFRIFFNEIWFLESMHRVKNRATIPEIIQKSVFRPRQRWTKRSKKMEVVLRKYNLRLVQAFCPPLTRPKTEFWTSPVYCICRCLCNKSEKLLLCLAALQERDRVIARIQELDDEGRSC